VVAVTLAEAKEVVVVVVTLTPQRWRARRRRGELTLAAQFLLLQLAVVAILLTIVGVISVRQSTASFTAERGSAMRAVAEYVANTEFVRADLAEVATGAGDSDRIGRELAPYMDRALSLSGASDVYLVSPDGQILAASEPSLVGTTAELGESDAMRGRGWSGDVDVHGERRVAAHAPILNDDGDLVGLAVAEQTYPSVWDRLTGAASDLALFLGLGAALGIAGTYVVSRFVKRRTRGLAPTEIENLADHREALLHSIREGVVAVGTDDRVTMMNDAARSTLGLDDGAIGRRVDELGLDPHVVSLLRGSTEADDVRDAVALVGTRVVVFNRRSASSHGRGIGSVTTLRDRTELVSLQSQLSSNLSITDTLRAQTHEFDNQLHTISGLVQLGEYDEVTALVGTLTRQRAEVAEYVSKRLQDPALAALMIAKYAVAEERGVDLELDPGSHLPPLAGEESADLTTVVGNLVDNAIDASAGSAQPMVEVWIRVERSEVHVRVRDNGPGVPEELRDAVFVRGFSTKPDVVGGRGLGLPLVRLICAQRGGRVMVDDAVGGGAEFRVSLPFGVREGVTP
jgi:sensor histidine kinase regulating citrate/malate metabolism